MPLNKSKVVLARVLKQMKPDDLKYFILYFLNDTTIEELCEILFNTFKIDLKLPKNKKQKIKNKFNNLKSRRNLNILTNKTKPVNKKRRALMQEGEGLGVVLSVLAPLITKLVSERQ